MSKVLCVKDAGSGKFEEILEQSIVGKFTEGMRIAVKLHMGEGKGMFSPEIAKRAVDVLKRLGCRPFLFDTTVLYPGPRYFKISHKLIAAKHGFSEKAMGCPVIISDEFVNIKTEHMCVEISKDLARADGLLVLSHVKGHPVAGFGGAIKNLAMGCASPKSKKDQHKMGMPVVNEKCIGCKICEPVCPFSAIKVKDKKAHIRSILCWGCDNCAYNCPQHALDYKVSFDTLLAEAAFAALKSIEGKPVFYVNDVRNITRYCDCAMNPGKPVAKDLGILLSDDIVAIDSASTDLINKQEGKDVFKELSHHDPSLQIKEMAFLLSSER